MKLSSMKITAAERQKRNEPTSIASDDAPVYPWGLSVSLDDCCIDKLGLEELPEVGATMTLTAKVRVTSVSSNQSESGANRNVTLQITDMALEAARVKGGAEGALYGDD